MFSFRFVQWNGLGGAVHGGEGGIVMGLIRRPGTAAIAGGNRRPCTPVVSFSRGGPGGAVADVGGGVRVGTSWIEGPRSWGRPRVQRTGTRNDWGPGHRPLLDLGGTSRTGVERPRAENAEDPGRPGGGRPVRRASGLGTAVRVQSHRNRSGGSTSDPSGDEDGISLPPRRV
jgi:hypothetical protein